MKKSAPAILCILVVVAMAIGGCTTPPPGTEFVTVPAVTVTLPGTTVTGVTTIPPITTTIPAATVTIVVTEPVIGENPFLSDIAAPIRSHAMILEELEGQCLVCHGSGGPNEYPISPEHGGPELWDGTKFGSSINPGLYIVVQDSLQDHADRQAGICFGCHTIPGG